MRAATDSANTLNGRLITISGFTMRNADSTDLARVVIICCAADAQLARIHLSGPAVAVAAIASITGSTLESSRFTNSENLASACFASCCLTCCWHLLLKCSECAWQNSSSICARSLSSECPLSETFPVRQIGFFIRAERIVLNLFLRHRLM